MATSNEELSFFTHISSSLNNNDFRASNGTREKLECYSDESTFITLKDHKASFKNNTKCRLINPSKSEVGLVIKHYLNSIISMVAEKSGVNEWRKHQLSKNGLKIYKINKKRRFIKFDIADFYPSITRHLLERSIEYAKSFATI